MTDRGRSRLVYSTEKGRLCPKCGEAVAECRCRTVGGASLEGAPTAKLRIETSGRGGKTVTVIDGLALGEEAIRALATELKKTFGTGGGAGEGRIEFQGDRRERLRQLLAAKGFRVKG